MRSTLIAALAVGGILAVGAVQGTLNGQDSGTAASDAPTVSANDKIKLSYGVGFFAGNDLRSGFDADGLEPDYEQVIKGFADGILKKSPAISRADFEETMAAVHEAMVEKMIDRQLENDEDFRAYYEENKKRSEEFIKAFQKLDGAKEVDPGVWRRILKEGTGPTPHSGDVVIVSYRALGTDGRVIDEATERAIAVNRVLPATEWVLQQMPVGSTWQIVLAPERAHGRAGDPPLIGPNEAIIIEASLIGIQDKGTS